jgi:hypothetical protein
MNTIVTMIALVTTVTLITLVTWWNPVQPRKEILRSEVITRPDRLQTLPLTTDNSDVTDPIYEVNVTNSGRTHYAYVS